MNNFLAQDEAIGLFTEDEANKFFDVFNAGKAFTQGRKFRKSHQLARDASKWITVKPNGKEGKGRPALIDDQTGRVLGGMGGKFNGKKINEVRKSFVGPETPTPEQIKKANRKPRTAKKKEPTGTGKEENKTNSNGNNENKQSNKPLDFNEPPTPTFSKGKYSVKGFKSEAERNKHFGVEAGYVPLQRPQDIEKETEKAYLLPHKKWVPKSAVKLDKDGKVIQVKSGIAADKDLGVSFEWQNACLEHNDVAIPKNQKLLARPQKILKETEKAYLIDLSNFSDSYFDGNEQAFRTTGSTWVPKNSTTADKGEVISIAPWLVRNGTIQKFQLMKEKK